MPRLLLDPWSPDYEAPIQTEGPGVMAAGEVDPKVESSDWHAIAPVAASPEWKLYFVDGVRRVEARVLAQGEDGKLIHGLFGSAGTGCVVVEDGSATYEFVEVR